MHPFLQLMRFDKPIGIWLLFFPAAWAVALAAPLPSMPRLMLIVLLGATITRAAGCIMNDLVDRRLDRAVARTAQRPLASGTVSIASALLLLGVLLSAALWLALLLPPAVFSLALIALPMMAAYPWMKRITWWPQLFLGLTFNLGAFVRLAGERTRAYPRCVHSLRGWHCWTLGYDTIYAVQDMADDAKIGIKSTARRLGAALPRFAGYCYLALCVLLCVTLWLNHAGGFCPQRRGACRPTCRTPMAAIALHCTRGREDFSQQPVVGIAGARRLGSGPDATFNVLVIYHFDAHCTLWHLPASPAHGMVRVCFAANQPMHRLPPALAPAATRNRSLTHWWRAMRMRVAAV